MKSPLATVLAAALLLTGCATQTQEQLAAVRASGVSPSLVRKLERWGSLSPEDIVELRRHRVNDAVALRQIERAGVDFVTDKDILKRFRKAGVSESVITAATNAGRVYEEQFRYAYMYGWRGPWGPPYDPFYYGVGWPHIRPNPVPPPFRGPGPGGPPPPLRR